jgi:hypothetical protein
MWVMPFRWPFGIFSNNTNLYKKTVIGNNFRATAFRNAKNENDEGYGNFKTSTAIIPPQNVQF